MENFEKIYAELKEKFNIALVEFLKSMEKGVSENLYEAMRYSAINTGKRIRPILCMLGARFAGKNEDEVLQFAIALELIHTYSLVHDDLPALDNDSLRRGRLTTHIMHGEAMGVLAGDALLNLAYEVMTDNIIKTADFVRLKALALIMKAAGAKGMLSGQAKDVDYDNSASYFLEHIINMYRNKTADLIRASLVSGALICGAPKAELEALSSYADSLGIYFQLQDDLLEEPQEKIDMNMSVEDYLAMIENEDEELADTDAPISSVIRDASHSGASGTIFDMRGNANAGSVAPAPAPLPAAPAPAPSEKAEDKPASFQNESDTVLDMVWTAPDYKYTAPDISEGGDSRSVLGLDKFERAREAEKNRPNEERIDTRVLLGLVKTPEELAEEEKFNRLDASSILKLGTTGGDGSANLLNNIKKEKMTFLKSAGKEETQKVLTEYEEYIRDAVEAFGKRAAELIGMFEFIKKREV
ncbi:MAG: polyprenyl synthetase family protein [Clostridiales bacterium]|jgi:geranylgeranyl pyrophosphate synthase|nr:polyprenyl synthetase family protein [Clostridiales bacterium]